MLNSIGDAQMEQKDYIFMVMSLSTKDIHTICIVQHYPDCLCQAVYSVFCQACPGSNKVVNSESFLDYLTNLISEWVTGKTSILSGTFTL